MFQSGVQCYMYPLLPSSSMSNNCNSAITPLLFLCLNFCPKAFST